LWGCDLTMETGLAKLRALETIVLERDTLSLIRWRNAVRIFPPGTFPGIDEHKPVPAASSTKPARLPTRAPTTVAASDSG